MPYLSAPAVVFHYEEALYEVHAAYYYVLRSHMYMSKMKNISYVVYDNVSSVSVFLSKPRALKTRGVDRLRRQ